jgi:hypothetical protein
VESIEASVRTYNISSSTLIFAAWALVLSKYTRCSFVSFYLSRSGRMVPWPLAPSLVVAMNCRVPFATGIPAEATVHEWLAEMHSTLLSVAELENLCQSLDRSIYPEEYFKTGVQAFLYMPQLPASWEVHDKLTGQADQIGMVWRVQPTGNGAVEAELDIDQRVVDIEWAEATRQNSAEFRTPPFYTLSLQRSIPPPIQAQIVYKMARVRKTSRRNCQNPDPTVYLSPKSPHALKTIIDTPRRAHLLANAQSTAGKMTQKELFKLHNISQATGYEILKSKMARQSE